MATQPVWADTVTGAARGRWRIVELARSPQCVRTVLTLAFDFLALLAAYAMTCRVLLWLNMPDTTLSRGASGALALVTMAVLWNFRGYRNLYLRRPEKELEAIGKSVVGTFFLFVIFSGLTVPGRTPLPLLGVWCLLALGLVLVARAGLRAVYARCWSRGIGRQKVVVVGYETDLESFENRLRIQRHRALHTVRTIVLSAARPWPDYGELRNAAGCSAGLLLLCASLRHGPIAVGPCDTDDYSGASCLPARGVFPDWCARVCKRLLDCMAGIMGSGITVLMIPVIGALIRHEDGGPVFYRSAYLAADGKSHYYLKFRTMRVDADPWLSANPEMAKEFQAKFKLISDPRVTRVGRILRRYSLDEFPQFFSVLLGQLSLVGPRTIRAEEGLRYGPLLTKLLSRKPGLTGFWQVMGRQTTSYDDRIQMDMFYIDHWSNWLDLVIIAKTAWKILTAEGAY